MINSARRLLITLGKTLPFIVCFVVFVGYAETIISVYTNDYLFYDGFYTPNTPISFWIAEKAKYDWFIVFVLLTISIAINTCCWNKLSVLYLGLHLVFKGYVSDIELEEPAIVCLCVINIIITSIIIYKGVRRIKL